MIPSYSCVLCSLYLISCFSSHLTVYLRRCETVKIAICKLWVAKRKTPPTRIKPPLERPQPTPIHPFSLLPPPTLRTPSHRLSHVAPQSVVDRLIVWVESFVRLFSHPRREFEFCFALRRRTEPISFQLNSIRFDSIRFATKQTDDTALKQTQTYQIHAQRETERW